MSKITRGKSNVDTRLGEEIEASGFRSWQSFVLITDIAILQYGTLCGVT